MRAFWVISMFQGAEKAGATCLGRVLTGKHSCVWEAGGSRVLSSGLVSHRAVEENTGLEDQGHLLTCLFELGVHGTLVGSHVKISV